MHATFRVCMPLLEFACMLLLGYACHFRVCMDVTFRNISKTLARRVEKNTLEIQVENSNIGCKPQWQDEYK